MAGSGTRVTVDCPDKRGVPPGSAICGTEPHCAAIGEGDLPLPKPVRSAIFTRNRPDLADGWVGEVMRHCAALYYAALDRALSACGYGPLAAREPASGCPDSPLEEAGFELSVPPEGKAFPRALDRFRRPSVTRRQA